MIRAIAVRQCRRPVWLERPQQRRDHQSRISRYTRIRTFQFLDRLGRATGTTANQVSWLTGGTGAPDLATMARLAHNEWLESIRADASSHPYATKVIRNKP